MAPRGLAFNSGQHRSLVQPLIITNTNCYNVSFTLCRGDWGHLAAPSSPPKREGILDDPIWEMRNSTPERRSGPCKVTQLIKAKVGL